MSELQNIGIITQARMTSTRLPGKVFKEIKNKSILRYHIDRLREAGFDIAIATTKNESDDCICEFAEKEKLFYHRGSEHNVLSRFYETAVKFNFGTVTRVTSDCPLIDPHLIRNSIVKYTQLNNKNLYMSNALERTFARGFDFEIFSFDLLEQAFVHATDESDKEHVTPYIWKNKSGQVELYDVKQSESNGHFRIAVDTPEDFELVSKLITDFGADKLSYNEIENILKINPALVNINAHIEQKKT